MTTSIRRPELFSLGFGNGGKRQCKNEVKKDSGAETVWGGQTDFGTSSLLESQRKDWVRITSGFSAVGSKIVGIKNNV